jgi:signal transduction histidine kinase
VDNTQIQDEVPTDTKPHKPFHKKRQLEKDIEHVTAEMYRRNKELAETNRTLSLLRTIDALVLETRASIKMVSEHIAEAITQATDYPFVGLMTRVSRDKEEVVLRGISSAGLKVKLPPDLGFNHPLRAELTHHWFSQYASTCLIDLDAQSEESLVEFLNCTSEDIRRIRKASGINSLYIVKLIARRQIVGLLVVGFDSTTSHLTKYDILLLDHLSESIGVALDNKLLFDENQHVLRQIKESNDKLKALDEAKDDFISMASHQLRTPLTSVKGYISMVRDGDAGEISPQQYKLLNQAFISSQRMVYIIADLLNVSRLRTGKFIMNPAPVNLAEMIEQEISQLKDIAASKELNLTYEKPQSFPELMLDDTKTRQVIMNFVDNAIYYTPLKGNISIVLKDNPNTVELRVIDDGIGVPKNEQHHLFTKFYRAGNARKARPDGTGLGLFMAKKIVIAQHGSLIFESKENQGSTFGFILTKAKLAKPDTETQF